MPPQFPVLVPRSKAVACISPTILQKIAAGKRKEPPQVQLDKQQLLESSSWYASLRSTLRNAILERACFTKHGRGELVRGATDEQTLDVVVEGAMRVAVGTGDAARIVGYLAPGHWFADPGLLLESYRLYSLVAHEPTTLLSVPARQLRLLHQQHPDLAEETARLHFAQAARTLSLLHGTNGQTLRARLASCLHQLCNDFGVRDREENLRITLNIKQGDLGRMVGASRQRVNRELKCMEREGVVSLQRLITVKNIAALRRTRA